MKISVIAVGVSVTLALPTAFAADASAYPTKPIRLIVPVAAGGPADMTARIIGQSLSASLGKQVVVDNRGGAGGNIGLEIVTKAAPDGYTLLASSGSPICVGPHLYKLNFDVARDLVPIVPLARILTVLVVRPGLPVRSVAELIAHARTSSRRLNYGSVGVGSTLHIHAERLLHTAKIHATHVPYKGAAQMVTALLSDEVDFAFDSGLTLAHVKAGKLRLLALAGTTRSPLFPDTPTFSETGVEAADTLFGVYAPTGTPREIVTRLNREIGRIMQTPETRAALATFAAEVVTASPEEFAAIQARDRERYGTFIRELNIRID